MYMHGIVNALTNNLSVGLHVSVLLSQLEGLVVTA